MIFYQVQIETKDHKTIAELDKMLYLNTVISRQNSVDRMSVL